MKKVLAVITAGTAALVLAGCGSSGTGEDESYTPSTHYAFRQEVEPGRFVTCVWANQPGYGGGLSCDWVGYHSE